MKPVRCLFGWHWVTGYEEETFDVDQGYAFYLREAWCPWCRTRNERLSTIRMRPMTNQEILLWKARAILARDIVSDDEDAP